MNIGVLTVNDILFHPNQRLFEAAQSRGHHLWLIHPGHTLCSLDKGEPGMQTDPSLPMPDIVLPRQGSPMGEYGFVILAQFRQMGIMLLNDIQGITIARNQYLTLQMLSKSSIPVPDSFFMTRPDYFFKAADHLGGYPVVVKPLSSMGGEGVEKIHTAQEARHYLQRGLNPRQGLLVQRFLPPEDRMDIRLLVIGNRVEGAVFLTPGKNEFRANVHQNSRPQPFHPSGELARLAVKAAQCCHLEIAGIDLIVEKNGRPWVMEVNYSPGFRGMEAATGLDIAGKIIDHAIMMSKTRGFSSTLAEDPLGRIIGNNKDRIRTP